MRHLDGRSVCVECGVTLDVPVGATPQVAIHVASGKPTVRVLRVGAIEVHRCAVAPPIGHDD